MSAWTGWRDHVRLGGSPYADWAYHIDAFAPWVDGFENQLTPEWLQNLDDLRAEMAAGDGKGARPTDMAASKSTFPVPKHMNNVGFAQYLAGRSGRTWLPDTRAVPSLSEGDVVLGVIDVDIGLGHRRFRDAQGNSRILAAWQQGSTWTEGPGGGQPHLPFGSELLADEINAHLSAHSPQGLDAPHDQEGFDAACGLVDLRRADGAKALAQRYAHGTHVLGLAGGAVPGSDFSGRVKLLVVNLPPAVAYGEGGGFLDHYLIYGLHWLAETHAQMLARSKVTATPPMVVNISFGKQAGPKEDISELGLAIRALKTSGQDFSVFLPAGNDNLMRCNALIPLEQTNGADAGQIQELCWRVLPDDETSNIVEIWAEFLGGLDAFAPFAIDVIPPGGTEGDFQPGHDGQIRDLENGLGRIYCDILLAGGPQGDGLAKNVRYQIFLAPDRMLTAGRGAPAGAWRIRLRGNETFALHVRASIQTDQATLPGRKLARRSYFEDDVYTRFDVTGRAADTFAYSWGDDHGQNLDIPGLIKRRGTINSYASLDAVVVGGFRASDGRPAPYSSSALDQVPNRIMPTAALRSDDGYAHVGLLSDGAQDGSVVAMQGTSFACALAARHEVERQVAGAAADLSAREALTRQARRDEAQAFADLPKAMTEKTGSGRVAKTGARLGVSRF